MMAALDYFLDRITMYRLVLYYLIGLLLVAFGLSLAGLLPFNPYLLALSAGYLTVVCLISNILFAYVFEAPTNVESAYITALILALIVNPLQTPHDVLFLGWAGTLAMASKYILAINRKHIFNPAAVAVVLTSIGIGQSASWWVGSSWMLLAVLIGGVLVVRKIRRTELVLSFLTTAVVAEILVSLATRVSLMTSLHQTLILSPLFFLGFVMLTEPLTTPPVIPTQVAYGALVGLLFLPQLHIGSLYSTPELALLGGNIFAYLVSPKLKLLLHLSKRTDLNPTTHDFSFALERPASFQPGQYIEWTLPHHHVDSRGNRRYFTIASSPTEPNLHIGVKFYPKGSSFKKALLAMSRGAPIVATHLGGNFTLPRDPARKLAFIAGGIGITPYRSMIKYLLDTDQHRDLALIYSANHPDELVYQEVFEPARRQLGLNLIYSLSDPATLPPAWQGETGMVSAEMIKCHLPDYRERLFYVSGPPQMVNAVRAALRQLGVNRRQIKTDFFPGYA
jgi:ferredoxin-NADP reductase/Na+-transporting NADH:ubiquinone oxidoreductase subunit NqrB